MSKSIKTLLVTTIPLILLILCVSCDRSHSVKKISSTKKSIESESQKPSSTERKKPVVWQKPTVSDNLEEVTKPDIKDIPELRKRVQQPIPRGLKNIPFVETVPEPIPTETEKQRGFILFSRPITRPVYKNTHPHSDERITFLANFATRGEYEPLTFTVYPLRHLTNFRVIVSDLISPHGKITKSDIDTRLVTYWKMRYPMYTSKNTYRELPELLEKVTINSCRKNECQRYWLTIHVPENTSPGIYKGSILLFDDVAQKAVKLPISFRVLPYKLIKDPLKHFSSFHLPFHHMYKAYKGALLDKAITADLVNMQRFGFDQFPTFYLHARNSKDGKDEFYIKPNEEKVIKKAIDLGFKGRIIFVNGIDHFYKRYCPNGKTTGSHGKKSEYPKDNSPYYPAITHAVRQFITQCKKKGWPPLLFFPSDEPREHNAEFIAKTYAAFKRGGAKTLITNDPTTGYAHFYREYNGVDIWCSQAFAVPYEKAVSDKRYTYWSYPNHNSGELKNRVIMQKGGRMTYGYGLWRSGYKALMPWAWRWFPGSGHINQFDYFESKKSSGTGNRLDENANFIPAIYWECFREGYDDGRYLYTLQQVMRNRKNNTVPECKKLVIQAQNLLNEIWQEILPKKKYLKVDFFNDDYFKTLRWRIADLTMELLKYKDNSDVIAPSVMADTTQKYNRQDDSYYIKQALKKNIVKYFDMATDNFAGWSPTSDRELKYSLKKTQDGTVMDINLHVDYKVDGAHKTNKYPLGWPYVKFNISQHGVKLEDYDFFYCKIKFKSNRDDVANDVTKLRFVFKKTHNGGEYGPTLDLGGNEDVWETVQIPLNNPKMKGTDEILLLMYEGYYPDQTKIDFQVSEIGLVKFKYPFIKHINSVDTLMTSEKKLTVGLDGFAFAKGTTNGYQCVLKLTDAAGKVIAEKRAPLKEHFRQVLTFNTITEGRYKLTVSLYDKSGNVKSKTDKYIKVIKSYLE